MDIIALFVSIVAVLVSVLSLLISNRNWQQSNRPIVTATVKSRAGNCAIAYDLVVVNGGNRPAKNVRLECDEGLLANALAGKDEDPLVTDVRACFGSDAIVPVLLHGESVTNSFGTTGQEKDGPTWEYGARLPVTVRYQDLADRSYCESVDLVIRDSCAFAGGSWSAPG